MESNRSDASLESEFYLKEVETAQCAKLLLKNFSEFAENEKEESCREIFCENENEEQKKPFSSSNNFAKQTANTKCSLLSRSKTIEAKRAPSTSLFNRGLNYNSNDRKNEYKDSETPSKTLYNFFSQKEEQKSKSKMKEHEEDLSLIIKSKKMACKKYYQKNYRNNEQCFNTEQMFKNSNEKVIKEFSLGYFNHIKIGRKNTSFLEKREEKKVCDMRREETELFHKMKRSKAISTTCASMPFRYENSQSSKNHCFFNKSLNRVHTSMGHWNTEGIRRGLNSRELSNKNKLKIKSNTRSPEIKTKMDVKNLSNSSNCDLKVHKSSSVNSEIQRLKKLINFEHICWS